MCYIANVGDSRAVISKHKGQEIRALTVDHRPTDPNERQRILSNGGQLYQNPILKPTIPNFCNSYENDFSMGPLRVHPGGLSVSLVT